MFSNRTEQTHAADFHHRLRETPQADDSLLEAADSLAELFELLEDYAPSWYTKEHHERAESALRRLKRYRTASQE